ncbi:MAG: hypothetical protein CSA05_02670 [Bacteroidia bacterium]|nr:MAG: hypothetical protein CSA05_02670 [Bacteroidia bacterium]
MLQDNFALKQQTPSSDFRTGTFKPKIRTNFLLFKRLNKKLICRIFFDNRRFFFYKKLFFSSLYFKFFLIKKIVFNKIHFF